MRSTPKSMLGPAIVIVLAALAPMALAQTSQAERDRAENERDLEIRVWNLRMLSDQSLKSRKKRPNVQQALAEMQEDFTRLQVVNKSLGRAAIGKSPLDLKFVLKSAGEIKKYAERLNTNLALPQPDQGNQPRPSGPIAGPEQLKPYILKLARVVFRFVDNPFFKEASVVDTELTTKARLDLEEIIELSKQLRKDSERFEKGVREKVP
jgi:hypothetical protein